MVTILRDENENLGGIIGKALGQGLGALAHHKLDSLTKRHYEKDLIKKGVSPHVAGIVSLMNPNERENFFKSDFNFNALEHTQPETKNLSRSERKEEKHREQDERDFLKQKRIDEHDQKKQEQKSQISKRYEGEPLQVEQKQFNPQDMRIPGQIPGVQDVLRSLTGSQQQQQQAPQQQIQQQASVAENTPGGEFSERFGQAAAQQQQQQAQLQQKEQQQMQQRELAESQIKKKLDPEEVKLRNQLFLEQRKAAHKLEQYEREKNDKEVKESKDWLKETNKKSRGLKENNARLERMEKLVESGKLDSPGFASALDTVAHGFWGVGINLKHLLNPESQEFEKLSNDMLSGIQDIFGSRILKTEVDTFLKTIPTLSQSNEGKQAVIENLKLLNDAKLAQDRTAKEIIAQNDGKVPADLELLVDERMESILDEFHDKFVNQMHKPVKNNKRILGGAASVIKSII